MTPLGATSIGSNFGITPAQFRGVALGAIQDVGNVAGVEPAITGQTQAATAAASGTGAEVSTRRSTDETGLSFTVLLLVS